MVLIFKFSVNKWRVRRRLVAPVFSSPELLKTFYTIFIEKNKVLVKNLEKEVGKMQQFDLWDYILPITLEIICRMHIQYIYIKLFI